MCVHSHGLSSVSTILAAIRHAPRSRLGLPPLHANRPAETCFPSWIWIQKQTAPLCSTTPGPRPPSTRHRACRTHEHPLVAIHTRSSIGRTALFRSACGWVRASEPHQRPVARDDRRNHMACGRRQALAVRRRRRHLEAPWPRPARPRRMVGTTGLAIFVKLFGLPALTRLRAVSGLLIRRWRGGLNFTGAASSAFRPAMATATAEISCCCCCCSTLPSQTMLWCRGEIYVWFPNCSVPF